MKTVENDRTIKVAISNRELSLILAALRYWQREGSHSAGCEHDIATNEGDFDALNDDEIDDLCDLINR